MWLKYELLNYLELFVALKICPASDLIFYITLIYTVVSTRYPVFYNKIAEVGLFYIWREFQNYFESSECARSHPNRSKFITNAYFISDKFSYTYRCRNQFIYRMMYFMSGSDDMLACSQRRVL